MEGIPKKVEKKTNESDNKTLHLKNAVKAAAAGAVFMGAVGGMEMPKPGSYLPQMETAEAQEAFNFNQEAQAFLNRVATQHAGIDDARGQQTLRALIEQEFNVFALTCHNREYYFSADPAQRTSLSGEVDAAMRDAAGRYLIDHFKARLDQQNQGLEMLKSILNGQEAPITPEQRQGLEDFWKAMGN